MQLLSQGKFRHKIMDSALQLTPANYASTINSANILIYATADWCSACTSTEPLLSDVLVDFPSITARALTTDNYPGLTYTLKITHVPTLLLFHLGHEVGRLEGVSTRHQICDLLTNHVTHTH